MTRGQVKGLIRQKKEKQWIADMVRKGIPLKQCDVCHRMVKEDHQCWATKYTVPGPHGSQKQIVFSSTGRGMTLKEQPFVDEDKITKEYQQLTADRKQSAERAEIYESLVKRREIQDGIRRMETTTASSTQLGLQPPSKPLLQFRPTSQRQNDELLQLPNPLNNNNQYMTNAQVTTSTQQSSSSSLVPPPTSQHASQPFHGALRE